MSLLNKSLNGIVWTAIDFVVNKAFFFLATIFLARILGPNVYGLLGMIAVFITIGNSLVDSGMSVSLIRTPNITKVDLSTVFLSNLFISVVVYLFFYILSPFIADFYSQPTLTPIIRVYCLIFIISSFRVVQTALLTRNLNFKKNTLIMLPAGIISVFVGFFLAKSGFGIWSVIYMYLTQQVVITILLWLFSDWKFKFYFSTRVLKRHFNFGYKLTLSGLLNTAFNNLNNIIIGRFYPVSYSGYYERAYSINQYPTTAFTAIIGKVTMPTLAKIQENKEKVENVFLNLIQIGFFLMSFISILFINFADEIVYWLLGKEWMDSVPFLQIISCATLFLPIHVFNINILQVYGRSDYFLKAELIKKTFQFSCILILYQFGIYWMISSLVFLSLFELFINSYFVKRIIATGFKKQITKILPILVLFLCVITFNYFSKRVLYDFSQNKILVFSILFTSSIIFYLLYLLIFERKILHAVQNFNKK